MDAITILRNDPCAPCRDVAEALVEMDGISGPGLPRYVEVMVAVAAHALQCASVALASDEMSDEDNRASFPREAVLDHIDSISSSLSSVDSQVAFIDPPDAAPTQEWEVSVSRTAYRHATVRVRAGSEAEAKEAALEMAGDAEFGPDHDAEYEALGVVGAVPAARPRLAP